MQNRTDFVAEIIGEGLHMDFERHVRKMLSISRLEAGGRPRPLRVSSKSIVGKKEMLARAKSLKKNENFRRKFISPKTTSVR